jgi:Domain of unknown function (DUF4114)
MPDKSRQREVSKVAAVPECSQQKLILDPSIIENVLENSEEQVTVDELVWELRYLQNFVERLRANRYLLCVSGLHLRQLVDLGEKGARVEGLVADWGLFVLDDAQQVLDRLAWSDQDLISHTIFLCRWYHCSLGTDRAEFFEGAGIQVITPASLKVMAGLERLLTIDLGSGDERSVDSPAFVMGQPESAHVRPAPRGLRFKWAVWVVSLLILLENLNLPESESPGLSPSGPGSLGPKAGPDRLGPGFSGSGSATPRTPKPKSPDSGAEAAENTDRGESLQATDSLEQALVMADGMANVVQDLINSLKATVQQVFERDADRALRNLALQAAALAIVLDSKAALAGNLPGLVGQSGEAVLRQRSAASNGTLQTLLQRVIQSVGGLGADSSASDLVDGRTRGADRADRQLTQGSTFSPQTGTTQQTPLINLANHLTSNFSVGNVPNRANLLPLADPIAATGGGSNGASVETGSGKSENSTSNSPTLPDPIGPISAGSTPPDQSPNPLKEVDPPKTVNPPKEVNLPKDGPNPFPDPINQPNPSSPTPIWSKFDSGVYTVDASGQVSIDYLYDGGLNQGELGIFDLDQLDLTDPKAFVHEAIRRVLSNSQLGHIVLSDQTDGAKFSGQLLQETIDYNSGTYQGVQQFAMTPGSHFGMILFSNSTFESAWNQTSSERPMFSLVKVDGNALFKNVQMVSLADDRSVVTIEDISLDGPSDRDYNDLVIRVGGATNNLSTRNLPEVSQKVLTPGSTPGNSQGLNLGPANGATSSYKLANDDPFRADRAGLWSLSDSKLDHNRL